jgi:hypothetical protein
MIELQQVSDAASTGSRERAVQEGHPPSSSAAAAVAPWPAENLQYAQGNHTRGSAIIRVRLKVVVNLPSSWRAGQSSPGQQQQDMEGIRGAFSPIAVLGIRSLPDALHPGYRMELLSQLLATGEVSVWLAGQEAVQHMSAHLGAKMCPVEST